MKSALQRAVGKVADAVREMNEAQRLMLVLRTGTEMYAENPDAAPDTYEEFLVRTSGVLLPEPSARKRARKAARYVG
jgi:hypothetical protein